MSRRGRQRIHETTTHPDNWILTKLAFLRYG